MNLLIHTIVIAIGLQPADADQPQLKNPYEGMVLSQRGDKPKPPVGVFSPNLRLGKIDKNGNFIPNFDTSLREYVRMGGPFGGEPGDPIEKGVQRAMYEFRTDGLIPGVLGDVQGGTAFVPEIGAKVLKLEPFIGPGNTDRIIYNRRDSIPDFWTPERKKELYPKGGIPIAKAPPKAGLPQGWKLVPFEDAYPYLFPGGNKAWFARTIGDVAEYGHLNEHGDFVPDYGLPVLKRDQIRSVAPANLGTTENEWHYTYTLPRNNAKSEEVYEYRSGRLIAGTLYDTGNFAPEIGSTILDFKDYNPESKRRIYNLPGVLRKIKK